MLEKILPLGFQFWESFRGVMEAFPPTHQHSRSGEGGRSGRSARLGCAVGHSQLLERRQWTDLHTLRNIYRTLGTTLFFCEHLNCCYFTISNNPQAHTRPNKLKSCPFWAPFHPWVFMVTFHTVRHVLFFAPPPPVDRSLSAPVVVPAEPWRTP